MAKQNVNAIVVQIVEHRARQRLIALRRRKIKVYPGLKNHYWVNRWEIKIQLAYAVSGDPFKMIDPVLNAVIEWDTRWAKERVKQIVITKTEIMKQIGYLERALTPEMYAEFVSSLLPDENEDEEHVQGRPLYREDHGV